MHLIRYVYNEFITEIYKDIKNEALSYEDYIQILRGPTRSATVPNRTEVFFYAPIVNWYYDTQTMEEIIMGIEHSDYDERIDSIELERYLRDKNRLETITVRDFLEEIKRMNKIV